MELQLLVPRKRDLQISSQNLAWSLKCPSSWQSPKLWKRKLWSPCESLVSIYLAICFGDLAKKNKVSLAASRLILRKIIL